MNRDLSIEQIEEKLDNAEKEYRQAIGRGVRLAYPDLVRVVSNVMYWKKLLKEKKLSFNRGKTT